MSFCRVLLSRKSCSDASLFFCGENGDRDGRYHGTEYRGVHHFVIL